MRDAARRRHNAKMAAMRKAGRSPSEDARGLFDAPGGLAAAEDRGDSEPHPSANVRLLLDQAFTNVRALEDEEGLDTHVPRIWFRATAPNGADVLLLQQGPHAWHAFYKDGGTGSGRTPRHALTGGLGDAIDTDEELERYLDFVLEAPLELRLEYDGLYHASTAAFNERGMQP